MGSRPSVTGPLVDGWAQTYLKIGLEQIKDKLPVGSEVVLSDGHEEGEDLGRSRVELFVELLVARHPVLERLHEHDSPALREEDGRRVGRRRRGRQQTKRAQALVVDGRRLEAGEIGRKLILKPLEDWAVETKFLRAQDEGQCKLRGYSRRRVVVVSARRLLVC